MIDQNSSVEVDEPEQAAAAEAESLFDGSDRLFREILPSCKSYGEYGAGQSTRWVLQNTDAKVTSVDTVAGWLDKVTDGIDPGGRFTPIHVDLGRTGSWGRPQGYRNRARFHEYPKALWAGGASYDVVLIDGRFRVACFLTSLRNAAPGTKILFDDYRKRGGYHVVEEFVPRSDYAGRQALFVVPEKSELDLEEIDRTIEMFSIVMD